ncbi:MAG: NAD-dependent epimerase/dehydratase family protein [Deltaproteobacteria bacterium]|nr:NAD-dependent epimerase/dehydratase family protein [Deltaproteobacteria bacterium]
MNRILITGAAGFIGFHLCHRLVNDGYKITAVDALIDLGDLWIKNLRVENLSRLDNIEFINRDISQYLLSRNLPKFESIIHLAAISGIERFERKKEWAEEITVESAKSVHMHAQKTNTPVIYASSSSVYGNTRCRKFSEDLTCLSPVSSYAKAKIEVENIFKNISVPTIGLRLFTVYGEYGRPDMSYFKFTERIYNKKPVTLYGEKIKRDFTYVGDVVEAVSRIIKKKDHIFARFGRNLTINIGTGKSTSIEKIVKIIGSLLAVEPTIKYKEQRPFDLGYTCCDTDFLKRVTGYIPKTCIEEGLKKFVNWYKYVLPFDLAPTLHSKLENYLGYIVTMKKGKS